MNIFDPSIFYTRVQTHVRVVYLHCIKYFTVRRFLIGLLYSIVIFTVSMINIFTRIIDEILFPNYKNITVKQPVFIISNPRSGTTFLHRLLCLDEEKFVYNLLYHSTFPSITFYRMIQFLGAIDKKIGKPLHKILDWINQQFFGGWDDIHATGFNRTEEDEGLHFISGISPSVGLITPFLKEFRALYIPDKLDIDSRKNIKTYYKTTIQRWMYALGSDKLLLMKSVMSSGRLELLHEIFPDVKIIFLIRNPYKAIPSFTSMFAEPWGTLYKDIPENSEAYREWGELGIEYYKYFDEQKNNFKKENFVTILYTDLVAHPKETVLRIYEQLELEISPNFLEKLEKATTKSRTYKSSHSYSLEMYGFEKEHIYNELKFIFDEFGFEK